METKTGLDRLLENSGVAFIKPEFIKKIVKTENNGEEATSQTFEDGEPPKKKQKLTGRNHHRPKYQKEKNQNKLCRSLMCLKPGELDIDAQCSYKECKFSHDIQKYLDSKQTDLDGPCHNFDKFGFCPYGITCRFGGNHIESLGSKRDDEKYQKYIENPQFLNIISRDVIDKLRRRKYDFTKASKIVDQVRKDFAESKENLNVDTSVPKIGPASDEDLIKLRPEEKKTITWKGKTYLAPLTTVGNLPFRRICKTYGVDITCGEMAVAKCLLQGSPAEWALVKRHESEDLFGVQVCCTNEEIMSKCAQLLEEQVNVDFVDINMGCPIDLIFKSGAGSCLMRRVNAVEKMVRSMTSILSVPVTLKMRTGIYNNKFVARDIIQKAKLWDVSLVTVHGRTREQRYLKLPNWDYVYSCAEGADPMPVFGNGDVLTYEDYNYHLKNSNLSGLMIGRGALIKPWIFTEIKEQRHWDISSCERFDMLKNYVNFGLEYWGSDTEGIERTRRFLLEWLSFLYRYIPVGILERSQKMNQRPAPYFGRNDLETLMASNNAKDWVTISEMLLGKVPEDFQFLPKHKANAWS